MALDINPNLAVKPVHHQNAARHFVKHRPWDVSSGLLLLLKSIPAVLKLFVIADQLQVYVSVSDSQNTSYITMDRAGLSVC